MLGQSLCQDDPLEKKMLTHSGILAWEIPWTEEPGGLQSMGSQKSQTRPKQLSMKYNNRWLKWWAVAHFSSITFPFMFCDGRWCTSEIWIKWNWVGDIFTLKYIYFIFMCTYVYAHVRMWVYNPKFCHVFITSITYFLPLLGMMRSVYIAIWALTLPMCVALLLQNPYENVY